MNDTDTKLAHLSPLEQAQLLSLLMEAECALECVLEGSDVPELVPSICRETIRKINAFGRQMEVNT
jgi:hypothetical protein